ncbi:MAG: SDR family NAD(P)-dependent oxidoreductase, partial [Nitrosomonas sp.]|nr:SDR family NAD(P)-dependent oxidoreductase [Nitrosomonas sp.]
MKLLQNKVAVVTGASRGIGAEIARSLANAGAKTVVNFVKNQQAADEIYAEITDGGGECLTVKADVSQAFAVRHLFDTAIDRYGRIDILINNAGILIFKKIAVISDDELDQIIDINFKSVFYTLREAASRLSDNGRIVNISSTVTRLMLPNYGVYAATKGAMEQLTHIFAKEVG